MKVSIIIPTNRYGGFDITFDGLGKQIFNNGDWEVIIIDDFIENRKNECLSIAKKHNVRNILYLRSKSNYWRSNNLIANARNTGLIYAKGELIISSDDYVLFSPKFIEEHWKMYKEGKYTLISGGHAVKYNPENVNKINNLPSPDTKDDIENKTVRVGLYYKYIPMFIDTRTPNNVENCGGGWFYSFNVSASLNKIIEVNGFDEEFDLTREEDIDLGLRLEKVGCKFYYISNENTDIIHMDHRPADIRMKEKKLFNNKYKEITYEDLRKRNVIESNKDEVQLVLKEKYGTTYDGSWGLHEKRRLNNSFYANIINDIKIFNLKEERKNVGL